MVINASIEYYHAKKKFDEAKTPEEKLNALYEMLKYAPKHKGAHNLLVWINKEIAKYRELIEKRKKQKRGRSKPLIRKTGDLLISILGIENSGKSTFLKLLTNSSVEVSPVPFTTIHPAIGTVKYNGVYYQFVEIPSTFETKFRSILSISDYFIVILDTDNDLEYQINRINQFSAGIIAFSLDSDYNYSIIYKKDLSNLNKNELLESIIKKLEYIRVFPINSDHAVILKKDRNTIEDFISSLNESWLDRFVYAVVYRGNRRIRAGLSYKLEDLDKVELKLKN